MCPLALRRGYYRCGVKIEEILYKLVGMLRLHSVGSEYIRRKIFLIEGYDHTGVAADGRGQNMAVFGVRSGLLSSRLRFHSS